MTKVWNALVKTIPVWVGLLVMMGAVVQLTGQQESGEVPTRTGPNGPLDLNLQDPVLVGALDVHTHLDPDISGGGQAPRAMDAIDMARQA